MMPTPGENVRGPRWRVLSLMAVQPVLMLVLSLALRTDRGPYWQSRFFDPDYVYLFSGLTIAKLRVPHHNDHPGTTLQVGTGALLRAVDAVDRARGSRAGDLTSRVIGNPERYLRLTSDALLILSALSAFVAGVVALQLAVPLRSVLLSQASWLLTPIILSHGIRVSPEAVFPVLLPWVGVLLLWYAQPAAVWTPRVSIYAAVLVALLVATKINALPWLALIVLPDALRERKRFAAAFVTALAVVLLPIYPRLLAVLRWIGHLVSHKGRYGSEGPGFIDAAGAAHALADSFAKETALFAAGLLLIIAFVHQRRFTRGANDDLARRRGRVLGAAAGAVWGSIAITTKHPAADFLPTEHYLLPVSGTLGTLFALALDHWCPGVENSSWPKWSIILIAVLFLHTAQLRTSEAVGDHQARLHTERLIAGVAAVDPRCVRVYHYRSSSREFALTFANDFSANQYSGDIGNLHAGRWLTFDLAGRVGNPRRVYLPVDTLGRLPCLVHQGSPRDSLPPRNPRRVERLPESWTQELATVVSP